MPASSTAATACSEQSRGSEQDKQLDPDTLCLYNPFSARLRYDLSGETRHGNILFCDGISERHRERYGHY